MLKIDGTFCYQWRYKLLIIIPTSLHYVNKTYIEYKLRADKYQIRNTAEREAGTQIAGQNHVMKVPTGSCRILTKFKDLGMAPTNQNLIHDEIKLKVR
jgi:hypothetical protein